MLKTRIITEIFKHSSHPIALFRDNSAEWHNTRFAELPESMRAALAKWAETADGPQMFGNYLFEPLAAEQHQLIIGTDAMRSDGERQLVRSLLPALAQGGDPWLTSATVLGPLLDWPHCAALKHKTANSDDLLGHWHSGDLQPPRQIPLENSVLAALYQAGNEALTLIRPAEQYPNDPLLEHDGSALAMLQRVDHNSGQAAGTLCVWGFDGKQDLVLTGRLLSLCADLIASHLAVNGREPSGDLPNLDTFPIDELTALPGRDAFDSTLVAFEEHYRHYQQNCEMAMLDINGLSSINQSAGIEFGDSVLRDFAQKLRHICRPEDRVFRFGGDEFVVLMPYRQEPPPLRERLIQIEAEMREHAGLKEFSASAGVASLSETNGSSDDLMLLSDRRLRQAKLARNQNKGL
ncbi:GAF domain/HD domain protein [Marinobacterium lacunae]|uniref:diguanylate cyclase n=1 Tax=Marinobacterium lacunae TaxID=1232683 RepID=A0A081G4J8_9GAMM|nr:GGDEF domain-containing protein [Marinobacterium lacunae]KEA65703.1 GAF domain/HD domain protein [Marinobacterium lacunae]